MLQHRRGLHKNVLHFGREHHYLLHRQPGYLAVKTSQVCCNRSIHLPSPSSTPAAASCAAAYSCCSLALGLQLLTYTPGVAGP